MTDQQKAFFLSVALGCFEAVRDVEPAKSARRSKLESAMDNCIKAVNIYNPDRFGPDELAKAGELIDEINERIIYLLTAETA